MALLNPRPPYSEVSGLLFLAVSCAAIAHAPKPATVRDTSHVPPSSHASIPRLGPTASKFLSLNAMVKIALAYDWLGRCQDNVKRSRKAEDDQAVFETGR